MEKMVKQVTQTILWMKLKAAVKKADLAWKMAIVERVNVTVEKFLLSNFSWSHTPLFGHILLNVHYKM